MACLGLFSSEFPGFRANNRPKNCETHLVSVLCVTFLFHDFVKEMSLQDIRDSFRKLWVQHLQILSLGAGRNGKRMGKGGREREELSHLSQQYDFPVIQGFLRKTRLYIYKMLCCCGNAKIILMSSIPSVITLWRSQTKRRTGVAAFFSHMRN